MLLMEPVEPEEGIYVRPLVSNEEAPSPTLQAAIADVYKIFVGNDAVQLANQDMQVAQTLIDQNIDQIMAAAFTFMAGNLKTQKNGQNLCAKACQFS